MLREEEILKEKYQEIRITCPKCKKGRKLTIPIKIVDKSEHLTAISIPVDFVCDHSFQVFIDKNFHVRAYQNADFEISKIEFYECQPKTKEDLITYTISKIINKIIDILRIILTKKQILGAAIFNTAGKNLYSSLPEDIFLTIANQLEIRQEAENLDIEKIFLILRNGQKIFSELINIQDYDFILVLYFSSDINLNDGSIYLEKLIAHIIDSKRPAKIQKKEPSPYWIFSTISKENIFKNTDSIYIDSLESSVSKSVVLNLTEIIQKSNSNPFKGKVYLSEKYVKLMEGLALTLKDAALFMSKLNKVSEK
ncbi:MAG: hypothetical protein ACFFAO_18190 [Candidatus Hermodarchaeota archaeon]